MKHRIRHIIFIVVLALSWCISLYAQTTARQLPDVTSTEGRDFYVAWLPNGGSEPSSRDLKLELLASSRKANSVTVEYANGATQDYTIAPGQTTIITIDPNSVYWDPAKDEEEKPLSKGIRVYSKVDEVFTLYSINQMGAAGSFSFDGAHILPVEALGTEYMVQTTDGDATATEFVIMSTKPGVTNVTMSLKVNSRRGSTTDLSVTLNGPKQIYIVRSKAPDPDIPNDFIDLSGSTICADQPIAVWSGNQVAIVPNQDGMNSDHAYDQLLPLNRWGKTFMVPMTAVNTQLNIMRIVAQQDGTDVVLKQGSRTINQTLNSGDTYAQRMVQGINNPNPQNFTYYVTATKPIQVYLYSSSAGANTWYDDEGNTRTPSDPSMTIIPPLEYLTDTTIFHTYDGGDGTLTHMVNLIAPTSLTSGIQMDGLPTTGWKPIPVNNAYSQITCALTDGTHIVTAPQKAFTGYSFGISDGQAYLYPIGYDFTPKKDSLFLLDNDHQYTVRPSEWKSKYISPTEDGWLLDRVVKSDGTYDLDSIFVCDSTTLTFPIKTYAAWEKVRWEIDGSIQGTGYFEPYEQKSDTSPRPELTHLFHLLPIEQNNEPFEDFEVRAVIYHAPIICDIPEEKWEKDTFNTVVRVLRQYNDTTWRAICMGDTVHFFRDTVWKVNPASISGKPEEGVHYEMQVTIFNDTTNDLSRGLYQYPLGHTSVTRHYISSGGCDSLSTIELYVCQRYFEHKDTVVCEDGLRTLRYGEFFQKYSRNNSWPRADTVLRDTLWTKECIASPDFEPFAQHCPSFHGCDSVLELHLNVKRVVNNSYTINQCKSLLPDNHIVQWREKGSDRLIREFWADTMEYDKIYTLRETVKYKECTDCPRNGCDSVRNTLKLQFVSDEGQFHTVHVCQGQKTTYRNQTNAQFTQSFDATGKKCGSYVYELNVDVMGQDESGQIAVMCSFVDEITFIVDTVYTNQMTIDTICWDPTLDEQTYTWKKHPKINPIPITGPGMIYRTDTMKTHDCKCDSVCELVLYVGEPYLTEESKEMCDNGAVTWQDTLFYGKNYTGELPEDGKSRLITTSIDTRRDLQSRFKCDSVFTLHIDLYPTYIAEQKDTFVCANEIYTFYDEEYNTPENPWTPGQSYELRHTVKSIHECDSMVLHNVTVYPIYPDEREVNDTVCQVLEGEAYYVWEGADHAHWNDQHLQSLRTAGTFELVDPLHTVHGCDSIIHRTLVILPSYFIPTERQMSSEDTIHWSNRIYAGELAVFDNPDDLEVIRCAGLYTETEELKTAIIGTHECDSVNTLTIRIGKVFRDTVYDVTCANCGTYNWSITSPITGEDTVIYITDLPEPYQERFYYDSLKTAMLYDSIYVLRLTAYPNYDKTDADEVCQGEVYNWEGHMPTPPLGEGNTTYIPHHLYIDGQEVYEIPTDQYGVILVTDSMKTDTIYTDPKTGVVKPVHCDSVHVLTLTIHPTYNDRYVELTDQAPMTSNGTLVHFTKPQTLFVGYDFDYEAAGVTKAELERQYDRVVYLKPEEGDFHRDSVTNPSQFGCDSTHYVDIHICEISFVELHDSIADNDSTWFFGGETEYGEHTLPLVTGYKFHKYDDGTPVQYDQATDRHMREYLFIDTLRTSNGCDSIVHDHVYVFPSYRFEFDTAVCSNKRYDWRKYTYLNQSKSGYVYDSVNYVVGTHTFDSVYVLDLQVVPSGYWQYDTVLCMNDTLYWHFQKIYYKPGGLNYVEAIYKDATSMCGDIYHLNLQFMPVYSTALIEHDTICQYDDFHWFSPGSDIEHTENLRDGKGHKLSYIPTDIAGDFLIYDSLKTAGCGCDSVHTLHLHIKQTQHFYDTAFVFCSADTLLWHDNKYYYQGEAEVFDTIFGTAANGCDSTYFMHVHFNISYDSTHTEFLCSDVEHYQWEDIVFDDTLRKARTWTEPRHYEFVRTYPTALGGCDSTLRLDLTIAPNFDSIWTDTICEGESYDLFGQILTEPGNYTAQRPNQWGCTTFYYLTLREVPPTRFNLQIDPICVDESGLANVYTLHYTYEGDFRPISYSLYYDSIAHAAGFEDVEDIPIAQGETSLVLDVPYFAEKTSYPRPGKYQARIAFDNGVCLSDSLMTIDYDATMNYPSWVTEQRFGDMIALLNENLNGGYTWTRYQWYQGDTKLEGQTQPYLYIPTGLVVGAQYHVRLTRQGENESIASCPITIIADPDGNKQTPTMGYLDVAPSCVPVGHPVTNILSRHDGTYRVTNSQGDFVSEGVFRADVTEIAIPPTEGIYIVQLWSDDTPEEPYRAIKIMVSHVCETCATSF